jgi:hypothetical protein
MSFPDGSCGFASEMLGSFLYEHGYKPINRVHTYCYFDRDQTHTWLEFENLIIDITADQFNEKEKYKKVFGEKDKVEVTSKKSSWYKTFNMEKGEPEIRNAHFKYFKHIALSEANSIEQDYKRIFDYIDEIHKPKNRK